MSRKGKGGGEPCRRPPYTPQKNTWQGVFFASDQARKTSGLGGGRPRPSGRTAANRIRRYRPGRRSRARALPAGRRDQRERRRARRRSFPRHTHAPKQCSPRDSAFTPERRRKLPQSTPPEEIKNTKLIMISCMVFG